MRALPTTTPNNVAAVDDIGPGNANHHFVIQGLGDSRWEVQFQRGPRGEANAVAGVFDDDLLAILECRMQGFQDGPYACVENEEALQHILMARKALAQRVADRMARQVLGKYQA